MAGTPMRHAPLSNEQILQALSESYNVVAAITKYQVFLTSGIGLPKDDAGRIELMPATMTVLEKIRPRRPPGTRQMFSVWWYSDEQTPDASFRMARRPTSG